MRRSLLNQLLMSDPVPLNTNSALIPVPLYKESLTLNEDKRNSLQAERETQVAIQFYLSFSTKKNLARADVKTK